MQPRFWQYVLVLGLLAGAPYTSADVVETRDGRHLEGKASFHDGAVVVAIPGKPNTTFKLDEVATLSRDPGTKTAPAQETQLGLMVQYFEDPQCTKICDVVTSPTAWFDWGVPPNENVPATFTARISGYVVPQQTGEFTIGIEGPATGTFGQTKLGVDGAPATAKGIKLEAGVRVPVFMQVSHKPQDDHTRCGLWWENASTPRAPILPAALRLPDDYLAQLCKGREEQLRNHPHGLKGEYFSDSGMHDLKLARLDPTVSFMWHDAETIGPMFKKGAAMRWTGTLIGPKDKAIKLTITGNKARLWLGNDLILDTAPDDGKPARKEAVFTFHKDQRYPIKVEDRDEQPGWRDIRLFWNADWDWNYPIPTQYLVAPDDVPQVSIVWPRDKALVDAKDGVTVHIAAVPGKGTIKKIELIRMDGGKTLAEAKEPPYQATLHPTVAEDMVLQVKMTNSAGVIALSNPVSVTVTNAPSDVLPGEWSVGRVGAEGAAPKVTRKDQQIEVVGGEGAIGESIQMPLVVTKLHGDSELIAHVASLKTADGNAIPMAGVTIRGDLGPQSPHMSLLASSDKGWFVLRPPPGEDGTYAERPAPAPTWLRITRSGGEITSYYSEDGQKWIVAGTTRAWSNTDMIVGLTAFALNAKTPVTAVFDNVLIRAVASQDLTTQPGVQLVNGSIYNGAISVQDNCITVNGAGGASHKIRMTQVARVFYGPVSYGTIAGLPPGWRGAVVRNDLMDGDPAKITADGAEVSSVLFGIQSLKKTTGLSAIVLADVSAPPGALWIQYPGGTAVATDARIDGDKLHAGDTPDLQFVATDVLSIRRTP